MWCMHRGLTAHGGEVSCEMIPMVQPFRKVEWVLGQKIVFWTETTFYNAKEIGVVDLWVWKFRV